MGVPLPPLKPIIKFDLETLALFYRLRFCEINKSDLGSSPSLSKSALKKPQFLQEYYGDQNIFDREMLIGAHIAKNLFQRKVAYEKIFGLLSLHRHLMQTNIHKNFGHPLNCGSKSIFTFMEQFPVAKERLIVSLRESCVDLFIKNIPVDI